MYADAQEVTTNCFKLSESNMGIGYRTTIKSECE